MELTDSEQRMALAFGGKQLRDQTKAFDFETFDFETLMLAPLDEVFARLIFARRDYSKRRAEEDMTRTTHNAF